MRTIIRKFTFGLILGSLFFMASPTESQAQIFGKKMPVGTKYYTTVLEKYDDALKITIKNEIDFGDANGVFDKYNFRALDSSFKAETRVIVFDRKQSMWRLPLTDNEANGIADKEGDEPLERRVIILGNVEPSTRQKVE